MLCFYEKYLFYFSFCSYLLCSALKAHPTSNFSIEHKVSCPHCIVISYFVFVKKEEGGAASNGSGSLEREERFIYYRPSRYFPGQKFYLAHYWGASKKKVDGCKKAGGIKAEAKWEKAEESEIMRFSIFVAGGGEYDSYQYYNFKGSTLGYYSLVLAHPEDQAPHVKKTTIFQYFSGGVILCDDESLRSRIEKSISEMKRKVTSWKLTRRWGQSFQMKEGGAMMIMHQWLYIYCNKHIYPGNSYNDVACSKFNKCRDIDNTYVIYDCYPKNSSEGNDCNHVNKNCYHCQQALMRETKGASPTVSCTMPDFTNRERAIQSCLPLQDQSPASTYPVSQLPQTPPRFIQSQRVHKSDLWAGEAPLWPSSGHGAHKQSNKEERTVDDGTHIWGDPRHPYQRDKNTPYIPSQQGNRN